MKTLIDLAYKKHRDWINTVKSFGCNESYAEDIVQEMYIQLHLDTQKGIDFSYGNDINHYYCYKVLRGIYLNIFKKEAKKIKVYLEEVDVNYKQELGVDELEWKKDKDRLDNVLNDLYWYDRKVFEIIASGTSIAKLSRDTKISYVSLYHTYRNTKKRIIDEIR